jgi:hypothetical protein
MLMLYKKAIAVYTENRMKTFNKLHEQNVTVVTVKSVTDLINTGLQMAWLNPFLGSKAKKKNK